MASRNKPIVLITGAAGSIGRTLADVLVEDYRVVGLDMEGKEASCPLIEFDLTDPDSVRAALTDFRNDYGDKIASVIHLAAYFDFTGEEHPLYEKVYVEGTRNLLRALARAARPP
jgi:nucleoside-diphosphate-sugar epimerase